MTNRARALMLTTVLLSTSCLQSALAESPMKVVKTLSGGISPKSVRASGTGLVSAHNMMYSHSVTIYDAAKMELVATVKDSVRLSDFGLTGYKGSYRGAPVEGSYSPDGKYLYVTNYAMYGSGFNREGTDICNPNDNYDRSFLYRINLDTKAIDAVYKVGTVPKVVEATPDNKYILVTNWCSYDLSIISVEDQRVVKTLKIGAYPRGIAVTKDGKTAYVAQMGGSVIHVINLSDFSRSTISVGTNPRALVLSPDEQYIYATLNSSGKVIAVDIAAKKVIASVKTGKATRSLTISADGKSLYVVNFNSDTMSKIDTASFKSVQTLKICNEPIGITYEPVTDKVWVACYKGQIKVVTP